MAATSLTHESTGHASARLSCKSADRRRLEQWARAATAPHRLVLRSQIVLLLLDGHSQVRTARTLGVSRDTVCRWERRFAAGGAESLRRDRPGRGRRRGRNAAYVARVLDALAGAPAGTWTVRSLSAHIGVSAASVQRIWREALDGTTLVSGQLVRRVAAPAADDSGKPLALITPVSVVPSTSIQDANTCR